MNTQPVTVFGAGSWGTALAISLAEQGHPVLLWSRRPEHTAKMEADRANHDYLDDAPFPDALQVTSDFEHAIAHATFWVIGVPSQAVRLLAERLAPFVTAEHVVVSLAKGIENTTLLTTSRVLTDVFAAVPGVNIGVLYGPSHAEEVALHKPTTVVAAAFDMATARHIQDVFMSPSLRVYVNDDLLGVEIGGSVKNILAIAAGMSDGIGFGDNAKAAIVTRGLAEIRRLGLAMGAKPSTFAGLAGIGDLVVTCMSGLSRNRYVGEQVGKGRSLDDILNEMNMVAEGVRTTASVHALALELGIELPITEAVYTILFEGKEPRAAVAELMSRSAKHEDWLPDDLQA